MYAGYRTNFYKQTIHHPMTTIPVPKKPLDSQTLKQTGEAMGLTRERIRQIEAKALLKLRKQMSLRNIESINQIL